MDPAAFSLFTKQFLSNFGDTSLSHMLSLHLLEHEQNTKTTVWAKPLHCEMMLQGGNTTTGKSLWEGALRAVPLHLSAMRYSRQETEL